MGTKDTVFIVRKKQEGEGVFIPDGHPGNNLFRLDSEGWIYFSLWRERPRSEVNAADYLAFGNKYRQTPGYLNRPLTTKKFVEHYVAKVSKEDGSVEAALRLADHIISHELNAETVQVRGILTQVEDAWDAMTAGISFAQVSQSRLDQLYQETLRMLVQVGLNPQTVRLSLKREMADQLLNASRKDRLGRRNVLVSQTRLEAASRRAHLRLLTINRKIVAKYAFTRSALMAERLLARLEFAQVLYWLDPQRLPAERHLRFTQLPRDRGIKYVIDKLENLIDSLESVRVRPYRTIGQLCSQYLREAVTLLAQDKREELRKSNYLAEVRQLVWLALWCFRSIKPEETPSVTDLWLPVDV